jgi:hypothetical protein
MGKRSDFTRVERDFSGENNPSYSHGHNKRGERTTEYEIWAGLRSRVNNENHKLYPHYGGRGITYDPRWDDFSVFLEEVGYRPSKDHSLDRVDNNKGYFAENVRWATSEEQARNRRNNVIYGGVTLKEWCLNRGFNYRTVWRWVVKEGKSPEFVQKRGEFLWGKDQTT